MPAPAIAPANCAMMWPMASFKGILPATSIAMVIAGYQL